MYKLFRGRNGHYRKSFLCFIFICIIVVCAAYDKTEIDKLSYAEMNNTSSISSLKNEYCDIFTNEFTCYSIVKSVSSRNLVTRRFDGSKVNPAYAVITGLLVLIGTFVLFAYISIRTVSTSHRYIISYIHNLDGMKH